MAGKAGFESTSHNYMNSLIYFLLTGKYFLRASEPQTLSLESTKANYGRS